MKLKSDRKNYVIMALCAILLVMSIGYAAFSSLLTINGTASLSDSFCVGFDNTKTNTYTPTAGITNGTLPTGSMSYSGTACSTNYQPNSSLSATFKQPGDKIEYTLTIANKSTFTVAIESILVENQSVTSNTTITKGNIKYTVEMPLSTTLASNAETTMKITAMFQNDTDVTGQYSGESQTINVKINAQQDDGNGGMEITPAPYTGSIYMSDTSLSTDGKVSIGESIQKKWCIISSVMPSNNSCTIGMNYKSENECNQFLIENSIEGTCEQQTISEVGEYSFDASTLNSKYYLKHDVVDDIITASYVCFVTDTEHCLRGGVDESSLDSKPVFEANSQIIRNYQTFYNLGEVQNMSIYNPGCNFNRSSYGCYSTVSDAVSASDNGTVSFDDFSSGTKHFCNIIGSSWCS